MKYLIRETDGSFVERSPTIGKWYAGFSADGEGRCTFFGPEGYGKSYIGMVSSPSISA